jgi:hypothetical protein
MLRRFLCARCASRDKDRLPATEQIQPRLLPRPALHWKYPSSLTWSRGDSNPDLRRAKASRHILACSNASGDHHYLQAFCGITLSDLSTTYRLVPARLQ